MSGDCIRVRGARQNNLKGLDLDLPLNEFIVVTGVSGSGKSSLAFDTVYSEGQRRYVETFSPYARQFLDRMDKPRVDSIEGIPPAIAIDQTNPVRTSRSTVGTMTEINDHLKLLFARTAGLYCRRCGQRVRKDEPEAIFRKLGRAFGGRGSRIAITFTVPIPENFTADEIEQYLAAQGYTRIHARDAGRLEVVQDRVRYGETNRARIIEALELALERGRGHVTVRELEHEESVIRFSSLLHCAPCDIHYTEPTPNNFSFNSPLGACPECRGFGRTMGIDPRLVVPDEGKTLAQGAIRPLQSKSYLGRHRKLLERAADRGVPVDIPWRDLTPEQREWIWRGERPRRRGAWYGLDRFFAWLERRSYRMHIRVLLSRYRSYDRCKSCGGSRLKPDALLWRLGTVQDAADAMDLSRRFSYPGLEVSREAFAELPGLCIHDVMQLPVSAALRFFERVRLPGAMDDAGRLLLDEIRGRLGFLSEVGLGYLTLDRQSRTLSGGEVQRINLTTALGASLVNALFVLDEPSIGLHARDMSRVIGVLRHLREAGNTLIVVEHDPQVMLAADRILDLGPGPGAAGGEVVFFGRPGDLRHTGDSLTARYLRGERRLSRTLLPVEADGRTLDVLGASQHNLRHIDVRIPLGRLVGVTGVSGSGKSTLVVDVLHHALARLKGTGSAPAGAHDGIRGHENLDHVVAVDQAPIGRTTRSNAASFVGSLDAMRKRLAAQPLARERGYAPGTFSFNTGNGRCPDCSGKGFEHVEMQFLSDVYLRCGACGGRRFREEVLEVKLPGHNGAGKSMADILEMTVAQAVEFFANDAAVLRGLRPLQAVGLDYLALGQPVPTLSGGEAQRLKLAGHLARARRRTHEPTLFIFDEPTTGLHFADVEKLLGAFEELIRQGHSVVVIEHNLDLIRCCDWIIDLGPEGGDEGGLVVAAGTPHHLEGCAESHTGQALAALAGSGGASPDSRSVDRPEPKIPAVRDALDSSRPHGPAGASASRPRKSGVRDVHGGQTAHGGWTARGGRTDGAVEVVRAREHNLKNVDISLPHNRFTVITGVSGSGKSTVAFDILFAEGQRRYLESLNAYARQFVQPAGRADVDAVFGIPPTVAIEQRTSRGGRKSTVATLTEIHHFLRLLFVKLGVQHCPDCRVPIDAQSPAAILGQLLSRYRGRRVELLSPMVVARKGYYTDLAKWAAGKGFEYLRVDGERVPTASWPRLDRFREHDIELPVGKVTVVPEAEQALATLLSRALDFGAGRVAVLDAGKVSALDADRVADLDAGRVTVPNANGRHEPDNPDAPDAPDAPDVPDVPDVPDEPVLFSVRRACPRCSRSFPELDPRMFSFNSRHGWCGRCRGAGVELDEDDWRKGSEKDAKSELADLEGDRGGGGTVGAHGKGEGQVCRACGGARLCPQSLAVSFKERNIAEFSNLPVSRALAVFDGLALEGREARIAADALEELKGRLELLAFLGLDYLALDRAAPTLSGGEVQRIRLAAQLGSNLRGVCYILDEPTIGLHPRDNGLLLQTLERLRAKGNTVVVVEHDEATIRRAEHLIDLGPGAGVGGGEVVASGNLGEILRSPRSMTAKMLANPLPHTLSRSPVSGGTEWLNVVGARRHNLKGVDLKLPLGALTCVTGVSGSGKSTLVREVLFENVRALLGRREGALRGCKALEGSESLWRALEVDQTPIGKTPRSCPATYIGIWGEIRRLFSMTPEARIRGYGPGRFSFNLAGGRCDYCDGQGGKKIAMNFLPDVRIRCERCGGGRFNSETLEVRYRDRTIAEVLAMSIDEALTFFVAHPKLQYTLQLLQDVGLGYLTLGQQSPTLSGGEAQRIKLVAELAKSRPRIERIGASRRRTLYVLDEPTIGLHMADVGKLIDVLHRLVDAGNTVVVIEHNLDLIAEADWVVDLGPEGGDRGGRIVAQGPPARLLEKRVDSYTVASLRELLSGREEQREPA